MGAVGTIASVVAALTGIIVLVITFKMPYIYDVSTNPQKLKQGVSFFIGFSIATNLMGIRFETIKMPGYKLRSHQFMTLSPELAEEVVRINFTTSPDKKHMDFGFHCYPVDSSSRPSKLEVSWRWRLGCWTSPLFSSSHRLM